MRNCIVGMLLTCAIVFYMFFLCFVLSGASSALSGPVTDGNLGDRHRSLIPPYDFVKVRFYVAKSQFYKFNISLQSDATLGVYGK